jgi:hypothetical protein
VKGHFLSKSKILAGWQCQKRLWLSVHDPGKGHITPSMERAFQVGHEVGDLARRLFPGGVLIGHDQELSKALEDSARVAARPGPFTLYEGTFRHEGVLIRADVLIRNEDGRVRLVEVKSSTSVKPVNHVDCAVQAWVLAGNGLPPDVVELAHIDNRFVYPGHDDYAGLLVCADLTDKIRSMLDNVPDWIATDRGMLKGPIPDIRIGPQCRNPYDCEFLPFCTPPQPDYPVGRLPGGGKVVWELIEAGVDDIREIPPGRLTSEIQEWVREVTVAGIPDLKPAAAEAIAALGWPRYYFDFETVNFAVPLWAGTRPYQALPFQWSCHVQHPDGRLEQRGWLASGEGPPMRECAETLLAALGEEGPVIVYTSFEKGVLETLAGLFPELTDRLQAVAERLYDLHPLTRANYYHPDMRGSWSIKAVLPTVAPELDYESIGEIREGMAASDAFLELMDPDLPPERRAAVRQALTGYCALDTLAMVRLAEALQRGLPTG